MTDVAQEQGTDARFELLFIVTADGENAAAILPTHRDDRHRFDLMVIGEEEVIENIPHATPDQDATCDDNQLAEDHVEYVQRAEKASTPTVMITATMTFLGPIFNGFPFLTLLKKAPKL